MVSIISRIMCKRPTRYIDIYKDCEGCPVYKYCGTMVGSIRLCNSYGKKEISVEEPDEQYIPEDLIGDYDDAMG